MESLLYQLINHIKEQMPSLSLVDEDYGQLEAIDKEDMQTYPVTFPCVLIDMPEVTMGPPICDLVAIFRDMISAPQNQPDAISSTRPKGTLDTLRIVNCNLSPAYTLNGIPSQPPFRRGLYVLGGHKVMVR